MPPKNSKTAPRKTKSAAGNSTEEKKTTKRARTESPETKKAPVKKRRGSVTVQPATQRKLEEGIVFTCGTGDVGQLGLGPDVLEKKRFAAVAGLDKVVDISAGGMHTVCLTSDGSVYTFGCDDDGALGRLGTEENSFSPEKVELERPVVQISAGDSHTAALLDDGRVFAWGSFRDSHGPMGLISPNVPAKTPTLIRLDQAVRKLASGSDHLIILTETGQLFSCGCPEQGQLGRFPARSASREARVGMAAFLVPQRIPFRSNLHFIDVWATTYGTFAKEKSEQIYRCGLNNYHQLGLNSEGPIFKLMTGNPLGSEGARWTKVTGGEHHALLLDTAGKVHCLGRKDYGRLGLGEQSEDAESVTVIPGIVDKKCVDVACGSAVSFAVDANGTVYGWGMGSNGQLSAGDDEDDVWEPRLIRSKQLEGKKVLLASAGGQHAVVLARPV